MEIIKKNKKNNQLHPYIPELGELYRKGRVSRREFLHMATLLGASLATATTFLASCGPKAEPTAVPATKAAETAASVAATVAPTVAPTEAPAASGPVRGGVVRVSTRVMPLAHPASLGWIHPSDMIRGIAEHLTYTGPDNITVPWLLESWQVSDDVKTWTLNLRKGITFNHGKDFTADDVIFNFGQWLSDEVGSSMKGMISGYIGMNDIEKVDDHTVILHCTRPEIGVPEHLYHYPAHILPNDFEGDFLKQPYGTGPWVLNEWLVEERASIVPRGESWRKGFDGGNLPYLDKVEFYDLGDERSAHIAALQSGQVDVIHEPWVEDFLALKDDPSAKIESVATAQTMVMRLRADVEPFTDPRVRKAFMLCQRRQEILNTADFGEGVLGNDTHVAPCQPAYCELAIREYDPEQAKALLAEAGYPDGVDVEITVGAAWSNTVSYAETVKADSEAAGFRVSINQLPGTEYWNVWTEVPVGVTVWLHRPLATMTLGLAYTVDENGKPAAWNESHWVDQEFTDLANKAAGLIDVEARREAMCEIEKIQQERGTAMISHFTNVWRITAPQVEGLIAHPCKYDHFDEVWVNPEKQA